MWFLYLGLFLDSGDELGEEIKAEVSIRRLLARRGRDGLELRDQYAEAGERSVRLATPALRHEDVKREGGGCYCGSRRFGSAGIECDRLSDIRAVLNRSIREQRKWCVCLYMHIKHGLKIS